MSSLTGRVELVAEVWDAMRDTPAAVECAPEFDLLQKKYEGALLAYQRTSAVGEVEVSAVALARAEDLTEQALGMVIAHSLQSLAVEAEGEVRCQSASGCESARAKAGRG